MHLTIPGFKMLPPKRTSPGVGGVISDAVENGSISKPRPHCACFPGGQE